MEFVYRKFYPHLSSIEKTTQLMQEFKNMKAAKKQSEKIWHTVIEAIYYDLFNIKNLVIHYTII